MPNSFAVRIIFCVSLLGFIPADLFGESYQAQLQRAVSRCSGIRRDEYSSGLYFNPQGYRSYYKRSACFQDAAILFRATNLCGEVSRRYSLTSSSWGYSQSNCEILVQAGIENDRRTLTELRSKYEQAPVRLVDFIVRLNGNGRDFDLLPTFSSAFADRYNLKFEIAAPEAHAPAALIHNASYYLGKTREQLSIFITLAEIHQRFRDFAVGNEYAVRATLTLEVGQGKDGGLWSDEFIADIFPEQLRTQSIARKVKF